MLNNAEIEIIAREYHRRYVAEGVRVGLGPAEIIDLMPYDELSDRRRIALCRTVEAIVGSMESEGWELRRRGNELQLL
jgi:hypothetical protein